MPSKVFSPASATKDVSGVALDHAPGSPFYVTEPVYVNGNIEFKAKLNPNDFDGSQLTGSDDFWAMGAFRSEGTSQIEGLSGQQCIDAGYEMFHLPVASAMAASGEEIFVSFPKSPAPDGAVFQVVIFTSDNNGP